ncbi:MTAP family purine nucleoside phosphorylase [Streptacidiphilus sp. P02-A3a]|uniref:MTAP family purine nucleoside phosphorylase n=1 Tax=Streptacidiphilus sp. P02-A3a TaxID=2704468 RepID=UPI0015FC5416|nr:MTAP family purine nucleoside phosphorylase [Streptacidiphilus sp. P02-A3a]QMU69776.1 MTAP family purine nucleoside phosphorylase [Streptacidiphilus sp. P02-A3a]
MTVGLIATTSMALASIGPVKDRRIVDTPFGVVEQVLLDADDGTAVAIRRSTGASMRPPHEVNYRANLFSFAATGVRSVIGTNIVGSLRPELPPGSIVLPDQFLDLTRHRAGTVFDSYGHRHVDMSEPYCGTLREILTRTADRIGVPAVGRGTYVAVEGPRFETRAEVSAFALLGGEIVGMTGATEAVMARELGLCYASLALVSNYAAGVAAAQPQPGGELDAGSMLERAERTGEPFRELVREAVRATGAQRPDCRCGHSATATQPSWREPMLDLTQAPGDRRAQRAD